MGTGANLVHVHAKTELDLKYGDGDIAVEQQLSNSFSTVSARNHPLAGEGSNLADDRIPVPPSKPGRMTRIAWPPLVTCVLEEHHH